jgi:hypothetical protein
MIKFNKNSILKNEIERKQYKKMSKKSKGPIKKTQTYEPVIK